MSLQHLPSIAPRSTRASGDRWLFGYADVVTLLFACFAALYAAEISTKPAAAASPRPEPAATAAIVSPARKQLSEEIERLRAREPQLQIELALDRSGTIVSLAEAGSFAPGQADLTQAAVRAMRDLASVLRDQPHAVRVEGHTDDRPIRNDRYASNWELSTARATRVVQWLVEEGELAPGRLAAAGYGEYHPRVLNSSVEARARNRRVDIVILDGERVQAEAMPADYTSVGIRPSGGR